MEVETPSVSMMAAPLIQNPRALEYGDEVPPDELQHRNADIDTVASALEPLEDGHVGDWARIYGPSGVGKTTLARFVVAQVGEEYEMQTAYIDALSSSTTPSLLCNLARDFGVGADLRVGQTSAEKSQHRLEAMDEPAIAIVDEAHQVDEMQVYQRLYRISDLAVVVVTPDEKKLFARADADQQVCSRIRTGTPVHLAKYRHDELVDILSHRITVGLRPGSVSPGAVDLAADVAAGNAREAIAVLKQAVKHAERSGSGEVTTDDVAAVEREAREKLRKYNLSRLNHKQQCIYQLLVNRGDQSRQDIQDAFSVEHGERLSDSMTRRHLAALVEYDLVEKIGEGRSTEYHPLPVED